MEMQTSDEVSGGGDAEEVSGFIGGGLELTHRHRDVFQNSERVG